MHESRLCLDAHEPRAPSLHDVVGWKVDVPNFRAETRQLRERRVEGSGDRRLDGLCGEIADDAKPHPIEPPRLCRVVAAVQTAPGFRAAGIEAAEDSQHGRGVGDRSREQPHMVKAIAQRHHATRTDEAVAGLQPNDAAI